MLSIPSLVESGESASFIDFLPCMRTLASINRLAGMMAAVESEELSSPRASSMSICNSESVSFSAVADHAVKELTDGVRHSRLTSSSTSSSVVV
jgi:hypothetical protein